MQVGGATINYTGLSPIVNNGTATNRVFDYTSSGGVIAVAAASGMPGYDTITSTTGESVTFPNPTGSLEVDANTFTNSITINQLDSGFDANLVDQRQGVRRQRDRAEHEHRGAVTVDSGGLVQRDEGPQRRVQRRLAHRGDQHRQPRPVLVYNQVL